MHKYLSLQETLPVLWVSVLRCISIFLTNTSWLRLPSPPPNFPVLRTGMSSSLWQSPPNHSMTYRGSYRYSYLKFPKNFLKISNWTWGINVQVISREASLHGFNSLTFIFLTVLTIWNCNKSSALTILCCDLTCLIQKGGIVELKYLRKIGIYCITFLWKI